LSLEIQAGWPCPHFVQEEPVSLGEDRRSLLTRAPVASAGSVRILVNDRFFVPSSGLEAQAFLTSSRPAPFRILKCEGGAGPEGNTLILTTGAGSTTVSLPVGNRVSLEAVQRALRLSPANQLVEIGDERGCLTLREREEAGPQSFIRLSGRGAESLHFDQRGARGSSAYPGWDLVAREDVYPTVRGFQGNIPARFPRFKRALSGNPTLKVTYVAPPERCPRCSGTWVENDYRFDPSGSVITIVGEDLLAQACLKAILTRQGSNPYHPNYGSLVTTRIGSKAVGAAASLIKEDVLTALSRVQTLQRAQRQYQEVTGRELLYSISSVEVRPSQEDPTVFFLDVVVRNASNQPVRINTVFSVPGTIALAGSNNKPLGLEAAGLSAAASQQLFTSGR
jgi:phage baseplate assembly protein W